MSNGPVTTRIEILGQNGEYLCVHGDGAGDRGVFLGEGQVSGIYDSPEKQVWKSGSRQIGAKQRNRKILARDLDLGFLCKETQTHTAEENESYLIQAIGYDLDAWDEDARYARMRITTDISGVRELDIVQYEQPDLNTAQDPIMHQLLNPVLKLRSGNPDWYSPDFVSSALFTEDGWKDVSVENPTPRPMLHKWVATKGIWTIPDFSWVGSKGNRYPGGVHSRRFIACPEITDSDGGMTIDIDLQELMARSANDTNILARFGGQFFQYAIPPYTQKQTLPVYCEGVGESGAMIQLVQPRRWPRPWGLELRA
jgi:hypothetical protein